MKKITIVLICACSWVVLKAQKFDNASIFGVWQLKSIKCENYFSYDGYNKQFQMGDELKKLFSQIPPADSKSVVELMPAQVAKNVEQTYFLFDGNNDYVSMGIDSVEMGSFNIGEQSLDDYKLLELNQNDSRQSLELRKGSRKNEDQMILSVKKDPPRDILLLRMLLDPEDNQWAYATNYTYTFVKLTSGDEAAARQKLTGARQSKRREAGTMETMKINQKKAVLNADEETNGKVYTSVQKLPAFPGGEETYNNHLKKILKYYNPREYGAGAGTYVVNISFTVNTDGSLSQIVAENDTNFGFAKQAIEIFSKSPNWIPAEDKGVKVRYRHTKKVTLEVPKDEWGE